METDSTDVSHPAPVPRRAFLKKFLAVVVGGAVAAVPGLAGLLVYLDPIRRKRTAGADGGAGGGGGEGFIDVAPLNALPADGVPRKFQVLASRVDAWNKHAAAPVGAVYLKRAKDAPEKVTAFQVVCPHAGCFVEPGRPDQPGGPGGLFCPCHNSAFHPDGSVVKGQCVSPRGRDELAVDDAALKSGAIRVKYQTFLAGTHEKVPTT